MGFWRSTVHGGQRAIILQHRRTVNRHSTVVQRWKRPIPLREAERYLNRNLLKSPIEFQHRPVGAQRIGQTGVCERNAWNEPRGIGMNERQTRVIASQRDYAAACARRCLRRFRNFPTGKEGTKKWNTTSHDRTPYIRWCETSCCCYNLPGWEEIGLSSAGDRYINFFVCRSIVSGRECNKRIFGG